MVAHEMRLTHTATVAHVPCFEEFKAAPLTVESELTAHREGKLDKYDTYLHHGYVGQIAA